LANGFQFRRTFIAAVSRNVRFAKGRLGLVRATQPRRPARRKGSSHERRCPLNEHVDDGGADPFLERVLVTVLQDRSQWAIRSFVEGCAEWYYVPLIDAIIKRASLDPLELDLTADIRVRGRGMNGKSVFEIPYRGDPFLWFLSPFSLEVTLPVDADDGQMSLAPGTVASNPRGAVSETYLNLICDEDEVSSQLSQLETLITFQRQAIWVSEDALELHLQAIACPPEWKHEWARR
jgi:hypothetical protein